MKDGITVWTTKAALLLVLAAWVAGCSEEQKPQPVPVIAAKPQPVTKLPAPPPPVVHEPVRPPPPAPAARPIFNTPSPSPPVAAKPAPPKVDEPLTAAPCAADGLPPFPWPNAPNPSVSALIPPYLLFTPGSEGKTLMAVAQRLEGSIASAGYRTPRYLGAGCDGFAIMLDLEHIQADGARLLGAAGFAGSSQEPGFSLSAWVKRLFYAPPGYYRQIVFVVSEKGLGIPTAAPTEGELRAIAKDGSAALPPAFKTVPYTWKHKVLALVYEFQKGPADGDARVIPPTGRLGATVHLQQAKLY